MVIGNINMKVCVGDKEKENTKGKQKEMNINSGFHLGVKNV